MCTNMPTIVFMLLDIQFERAKAQICGLIIVPIDKEIDTGDGWTKAERTRNYPKSNWGGLPPTVIDRGFTNKLHDGGGGRYGKEAGGDSKIGFSINDFRGIPPNAESDKGPGPDTCDNIGPIVLIMLAIYMDRGLAAGMKLVCDMVADWNTINWEQPELPGLGMYGFKNEWLRIPEGTDGALEEDCNNLPAYILSQLNRIPGLLDKLLSVAIDKALEGIRGPLCNVVTGVLYAGLQINGDNPLKVSPNPGKKGLFDGVGRAKIDTVTYDDQDDKEYDKDGNHKYKVEGIRENCGNLIEFVIQFLKRIVNFITELPEIIGDAIMEEINNITAKLESLITETVPKLLNGLDGVGFAKAK